MKLFDKLKTSQKNFNQDKDVTPFVIKNDKFDLFFNQFWKWKNKEENSLKEKVEKFYIVSKVPHIWSETSLYIWNNPLSL